MSSFVLRAMMSGQYWPEGDEVYHAELTVPVLLVHGMHDKFVPVEEDQRMAEVQDPGVWPGRGLGRGCGPKTCILLGPGFPKRSSRAGVDFPDGCGFLTWVWFMSGYDFHWLRHLDGGGLWKGVVFNGCGPV